VIGRADQLAFWPDLSTATPKWSSSSEASPMRGRPSSWAASMVSKMLFWAEAAEIMQQANIEIAAVHQQVLFREAGQQWLEFQAGREHIHEKDLLADEELHQADPRLVMIHVVGLGIEGDLLDAIEGGQERLERTGLVEELVGGRSRGHFHTEQTANAKRKEAGNHATGGFSHAVRKASISKGRSSL